MFLDKNKQIVFLLILLSSLFLIASISLTFGQVEIPLKNVLAIICDNLGAPEFLNANFSVEEEAVIWHIRTPRMLVGIMTGAALGVSGAVMQGVFSNPLADPGVIGLSSGAAAGAVTSIALGWAMRGMFIMPAVAFCGGILAVTLTVFLALKNGKIPVTTLLLAGVAVGMFLSAITSGILTFISEQKLQQYLFWMVGGLDYRRWEHVYLGFAPIVIGISIIFALARHLNTLALGEINAKTVGMPVMRFRTIFIFIAAICTATSVCISGNIGFVGLVMPHLMRMLIGPDHRILLPASALGGALFLVLCDSIGRVIFTGVEVRVGVVTAILGAPYFLFLLRRTQRKNI